MNGFDLNRSNGHQAGRYAYQYVAKRYIKPYWDMAQQYVLADEMFPTMFGGSFTAHLDLIAGTTNLRSGVAEVDVPLALPWGCDAPGGTRTSLLDTSRIERWGGGPFPCFTQFATAADLLDRARVVGRITPRPSADATSPEKFGRSLTPSPPCAADPTGRET